MRLFSRIATLQGPPADVGAWAVEMTELVNDSTDLDISLWQGSFGYPMGTVIWSTIVEGRAQLMEGQAQLMANPAYHELGSRAAEWASPFGAQDTLRNLVHATQEPSGPPPVGSVSNVVTATPNNGKLADAMAWGVEVADLYTSITGAGVGFLADAYGTFGQMTWIAGFDTPAAADEAEDKLNASADYMAAINSAGDLFVPGSGEQRMIVRVA